MTEFDPISALIGGGLIGLASALLMLLNGRIAGISGILGGVLTVPSEDKIWRLCFIAGLIVAPIILGLFGHVLAEPQMPASWPLIVVAGVLVGVGARYGGGCTSGHGVCGIARLSARSIVATGHFHGHRNRCGCNNAARLWRLNHASACELSVWPDLRFRSDDLVHDAARKGSWLSRHFWPLGPDARLRYGGCARHLQHGLRVGTTSDTAG